MAHVTLKALGGCAITTNVIVQRPRGHTAVIIPPAAAPNATDDLDLPDELLKFLAEVSFFNLRLLTHILAIGAPNDTAHCQGPSRADDASRSEHLKYPTGSRHAVSALVSTKRSLE